MKKEELIQLLNAGYTKAEIEALENEEPNNNEAAAEASGDLSLSNDPGESDGARPNPGHSQEEDVNKKVATWLEKIEKNIDEQLKKIIEAQQKVNVKTFSIDGDSREVKTARDVYNEVYNPQVFNVEEE